MAWVYWTRNDGVEFRSLAGPMYYGGNDEDKNLFIKRHPECREVTKIELIS